MVPHLFIPEEDCQRTQKTEQDTIQRTTVIPRGEYPDESDSDSHDNRRHHDGRRPSGRRRYPDRSGRPLDRRDNHDRGYSRGGRPPDDGGPSDDRGPPDDGEPSENGGVLMMEDPLEMDKIQDALEDEDHQDPLDQ